MKLFPFVIKSPVSRFGYVAKVAIGVLIAATAAQPAGARSKTKIALNSGPEQVYLIELFTSEGCSSCPSADQWFATLREDPDLWTKFAPVAFHVDYWNYLGWTDRFASAANTRRQESYAQAAQTNSVYTPEFVLNGGEWRSTQRRRDLDTRHEKAGILTATSDDGRTFSIHFKPTESRRPLTIHAALLGSGLTSQVMGGENRGVRLVHDFVAISTFETAMTLNAGTYEGKVEITSPSLAKEAKSLSIAFWITEDGSARPIQALGGELPF